MTTTSTYLDEIHAFQQAYDYDAGYMVELLESSPEAFATFAKAEDAAKYRRELPVEAFHVAGITVMMIEDCGTCLQLNLRMAVQAGVHRETLALLLESPEKLSEPLRDVWEHVSSITRHEPPDPACAQRIKQRYGREAFAELALHAAMVRMYPTLKRGLMMAQSCQLPTLDF
ncbi:Carboxymuconolactone decarboxylase family protein [Planctomycetes bacterium Pan216]|uniref:Carboxymuconolactone decarboxylase family protein n=1 Tax=Kolteria novifilia TaxID=2527975 RepID=A0A518B292_9BACT|nr:Carboxymuconolactone decarboxylase family protein [Planctomycetes bacterium Pan216]